MLSESERGRIISKNKEKIELFFEFAFELGSKRNIDDVLSVVADSAKKILDCDRASIFVYNKETSKLWTKVAHGLEQKIEVDQNVGIVGWVFSNRKPLIVNSPYSDPRFNPETDKKTGYRTKSIIAVPLITYSGNAVGVLEGINKNGEGFTDDDLEFARVLAVQAANAIENAILYEELKKAQEEIVMRLSIAAEFRDSTTYNHLVRMSLYSYLIAKEMGFDEEWCEKLKLAAPMHDIGKLGVKDTILLKPAKLTDEEFEEMKKHTIYGYEILKDSTIDILKMASNIALCHHEKYDGTGYPRGLKGEEIPIEARIVAVADVFDALTSRRPYKEPYEIERAVEIIEKDSGKHFDPKVVQAFKRALPEIIKILKKYGVE
jgi:HD superfamily phosphodiesterase